MPALASQSSQNPARNTPRAICDSPAQTGDSYELQIGLGDYSLNSATGANRGSPRFARIALALDRREIKGTLPFIFGFALRMAIDPLLRPLSASARIRGTKREIGLAVHVSRPPHVASSHCSCRGSQFGLMASRPDKLIRYRQTGALRPCGAAEPCRRPVLTPSAQTAQMRLRQSMAWIGDAGAPLFVILCLSATMKGTKREIGRV